MTIDTARLAIAIETGGIEAGIKLLREMEKESKKVEKSTGDLSKSFKAASDQTDKYGNALTEADKAAGRFIDKTGRMREKNGQFVKGMKEAAIAAGTYSEQVKKGAKSTVDLSANIPAVAKGVAGVATAAVAATGALVAMTAAVADQVKETDNWAKALGIATGDLQALQAAARTAGIDADNMANILKDVNEKIGEAFVDGGGEGSEALKLLGVEVENIIDLPVDEKLKVIGDALQDIEGQASKSAIGEMLANDFTLLLPLLEDGNAGLEEMIEKAYESGVALSSFDNTALREVSDNFAELGRNITGSKNLLSAEFAPTLVLAQEKIGDIIDAFKADDIEAFVSYGVDAIGVLIDAVQMLEMGLRTVGVMWTSVASFATGAMAESAEAVATLINIALTPLREAIATIAQGWGLVAEGISKVTTGGVSERFKAASDALKEFSQDASDFMVQADDIRDANDAVNKSLAEQIKELEALAKSPAYSDQFKQRLKEIKDEIQAKADASDREREASNKVSKETKNETGVKDKLTDAQKKLNAASENFQKIVAKQNKENEQARDKILNLIDPVRKLEQDFEVAQRLFDKGLINGEQLDRYAAYLDEMAERAMNAGKDAGEGYSKQFQEGIASDIGQAVTGSLIDGIDSQESKKKLLGTIGGAFGSAFGPIGKQIGEAIGMGMVATIKRETFTDVQFGGGGVADAQSVLQISRKSMFSSSVREFVKELGEAEDIIDRGFKTSGREIKQAFEAIGFDVSESLSGFSADVRVNSGDLEGAVDQATEGFVDAEFAAAESFLLINEALEEGIIRLGENAEAINAALSTLGETTSDVFGEVSAEREAQLIAEYNEQIATTTQKLEEMRNTLAAISEIPIVETPDGERIPSSEEISRSGIEGLTAFNFQKFVSQLEFDISAAEELLETSYARLGDVTKEAVVGVQDELLTAISEITGVGIGQAGAELNRLTALYVDNFFTESERLEIAVENSKDVLADFADLGITTETSLESLRDEIETFKDSDAFNPETFARYLAGADALKNYDEALKASIPAIDDAADAISGLKDVAAEVVNIIPQRSTAFADTARGQRLQGLIDSLREADEAASSENLIDALDRLQISESEISSFLNQIAAEGTKVFSLQQDVIQSLGLTTDQFINDVELVAASLEDAGEVAEKAAERFAKIEDFAGKVSEATALAQRSIDAESDRISDAYQAQIDAIRETASAESELAEQRINDAQESISNLRAIQSLLIRTGQSLRFDTSLAQQQAASAQLQSIISSGAIPSADELEPLLGRLTDINEDQFATAKDAEFAQAVAANQIKQLQDKTSSQLTVEEEMLAEIESGNQAYAESVDRQIEALEQQRDAEITANESQLNELLGIRTDIVSVRDAINGLKVALSQQQAAQSVSVPGGASIVSQVGSGSGVSTIFEAAGGATGVIDTGAFGHGGTSASITIDPDTGDIISSSGNTALGSFSTGGYTGNAPRNAVTGIVHGQEGVLNAGAMSNIGIPALNAMNAGVNPADLYRSSVTIDVSSIVNAVMNIGTTMTAGFNEIINNQREIEEAVTNSFNGAGFNVRIQS